MVSVGGVKVEEKVEKRAEGVAGMVVVDDVEVKVVT